MGPVTKNAAVQFFWEEYLSFQGGDLQPLANYKTTILQIHKAPTPPCAPTISQDERAFRPLHPQRCAVSSLLHAVG